MVVEVVAEVERLLLLMLSMLSLRGWWSCPLVLVWKGGVVTGVERLLVCFGGWCFCCSWWGVELDVGMVWLMMWSWCLPLGWLLLLFYMDVVVGATLKVVAVVLEVFFSWVSCFAPVLSLLMFWYWVVDGDTGRVGSSMDWRWWYCCCLWCIWGWSLSPLVLFALC